MGQWNVEAKSKSNPKLNDEQRGAPEGNYFPRGADLPPNSPLFWVENKDRYLRQLLIRDIEQDTNRPLCVYFASRALTSQIMQEDVAQLLLNHKSIPRQKI